MKKPVFVTIKPEGFVINGQFKKEIRFIVQGEFQARKLWASANNKNHLACFSSNGHKSFNGKHCDTCSDIKNCQLKLRLLFKLESLDYCLELPKTSYENYRKYTTTLLEDGLDIKRIITIANVIDRGYWGEVLFSTKINSEQA